MFVKSINIKLNEKNFSTETTRKTNLIKFPLWYSLIEISVTFFDMIELEGKANMSVNPNWSLRTENLKDHFDYSLDNSKHSLCPLS